MDELEYLEENHSDKYDKAIVFIHGWKGNKDSDQGSLNDPPTQKQSSPFHCAFEIAGEGLPQ